jgi:hypothetical protein
LSLPRWQIKLAEHRHVSEIQDDSHWLVKKSEARFSSCTYLIFKVFKITLIRRIEAMGLFIKF